MSVERLQKNRMLSCLDFPSSRESFQNILKTFEVQSRSNNRLFSQRRKNSKCKSKSKDMKNLPIINITPKKPSDDNFLITNQMKYQENFKPIHQNHRNSSYNTFRPVSRMADSKTKHSFKVFNFPPQKDYQKEEIKSIRGYFKKRSRSKISNENLEVQNYDMRLMKVAKKELFQRINTNEIPTKIKNLVEKFRISEKSKNSEKKFFDCECFVINGWETEG
jgi:hypothetical protein